MVFKRLRLRLTLLYLLVALALVALVGGGAYALLSYYLQRTTDLALQHKMAHEFQVRGVPAPPELIAADQAWYANRGRLFPNASVLPTPSAAGAAVNPSDDAVASMGDNEAAEETYDGEMNAIFVRTLDAQGRVIALPGGTATPFASDQQSVAAAQATGHDWRTIRLSNGAGVRLLTYRLRGADGLKALQLGRTLTDQEQVLRQLLLGLMGLGAGSALLLSAVSWSLAGRSLRATQLAWERQQVFVANASHELRAPLTLMRASAEVALRGLPPSDAERRLLLDDVLHECDHMSRLVNDMLLLSRLDAHQIAVNLHAIALPEFLANVQRQVARLADERGVRLVAGSLSGEVLGDHGYLRQVLVILLDNALRHTPTGGSIRIDTEPFGRYTHILVSDTGSGIAPDHLPHVFERFYRSQSSQGNESNSSGLGLSLAKALIDAQHGQISIESRVNVGTQVIVALPRWGK